MNSWFGEVGAFALRLKKEKESLSTPLLSATGASPPLNLNSKGAVSPPEKEIPDPLFQFKKKNKVAIVGFAPSSMKLAPFGDPDWEIWTLNNIYAAFDIPRWDRWFELHPNFREYPPAHDSRVNIESIVKGDARPVAKTLNHLDWLKKQPKEKPIYFLKHEPDIPAARPYPMPDVLEWCKHHNFAPYFTNSISYMIALAIGEGYQQIGIWGVDMAAAGEYEKERPSVEYWIALAQGLGIKVFLPKESELLKARLYGFQSDDALLAKLKVRKQELLANHNQAIQQTRESENMAWYFKGALEDQDFNISRLQQ